MRSARVFLILFGAHYLGDDVFGLLTGWGYFDSGIFTNTLLGPSLSLLRIAVNWPHVVLGAVALIVGVVSVRRA